MADARPLFTLAAAFLSGCSLLCSTSGIEQPCDALGNCAPNYACNKTTNLCEKSQPIGPQGCTVAGQDTECLQGACVNQVCTGNLLAWSDGTSTPPTLGCFETFYPTSTDAGPYGLGGCVTVLPGDTFAGMPVVFLPDSGATAGIADSGACSSGRQFVFSDFTADGGVGGGVPVNAFVEIDSYASPSLLVTRTTPVFVPASQARTNSATRNVMSLSAARAGELLAAMNLSDGGLQPLDGGTLILGVVNDCTYAIGGIELSGVQVIVERVGGPAVYYLDVNGNIVPNRTATGASGLYASYVPASVGQTISITYVQDIDGGEASLSASGQLNVDIVGGGIVWVPVSPQGP